MDDNGYFSPDQSGLFRLHSTETCLPKTLMNGTGLDIGELVRLTFIDLKMVFDTYEHDILCKELEYYGPGGGGVHDLRMDGDLPLGFQKATLL